MKTKVSMLAMGLVLVALSTNVAAVGGYTPHAPIACVDGVLVTSYGGDAYDPTGVTGSGTQADPYVIQGALFDLVAYADHPAAVVAVGAGCNFEVHDSQTYGDLGYYPPCMKPQATSLDGMGASLAIGEVADFAVLAMDGASVLVYNTLLKGARLHSIGAYEANVRIEFSEVRLNYGGGVRIDGMDAMVNVTNSYIGFNGWVVPEGRELRWVEPTTGADVAKWLPLNAAATGIYVTDGGLLEMYNSTADQNVNNIVVDQEFGMPSDTVANQNEVIRPSYRSAMTTTNAAREVVPCTSHEPPSFVYDLDDPWGPEEVGQEFTLRYQEQQSESSSSGVSIQEMSASSTDLPNVLDGPDSQTDPWAIDLRFNFWGQMTGPEVSQTQGEVDAKFWLPVSPPAAQTSGLLREHAPQEQKVVNAVLRDAQDGSVEGLLADLRALLP